MANLSEANQISFTSKELFAFQVHWDKKILRCKSSFNSKQEEEKYLIEDYPQIFFNPSALTCK